ncbi:HEPN/Toprim-associated domain-containing protein [Pseudanabaena yagii]|uniref:HEPN/Toprim N-terminal domain-containing protein n=1 Tax=Pseudanabaena yagii GIHE-NHR1 TaxID=2722753 RepID=A0ABX1LTF9_9CYAN|nr:HEPN/Toprim-associated domain-containing protein [Pseudanabaena yagii]NMF58079.1 hypothetical protein [Pseudanabaena yagii GIHE-NHR1]
MGSYAECWLNNFYVGSTWEGDVDVSLMSLFRATDKKIITVKDKSKLPNQLSRWIEYIEKDDEINMVFYSTSTKVIKDRLELSGYSLEISKKVYEVYLQKALNDYKKRFEPYLDILSAMNVEYWLSMLKEIRVRNIRNKPYDREKNENPFISYMCSHDWYGFPCIGYYGSPDVYICIALRLILETCIEDEEFIYDLTDLILGQCFDLDDDFVDYTSSLVGDKGKIIILTEGKSDTFILSESLELLYPHLSDYFSFMDFDGAKVGGGADSLATMVKSFSGAGVLNRIIAVFDNDTAAHVALKMLRKIRVSNNIKIMSLPEIDILNSYPTLSDNTITLMNVNGLAGGIEAYLGENILRNDEGNYIPLHLTGYEESIKKYQGKFMEKDTLQKKFKQQLELCKNDRSLINNFDWSGIKAIFENIFTIFHEEDEKIIISSIDSH